MFKLFGIFAIFTILCGVHSAHLQVKSDDPLKDDEFKQFLALVNYDGSFDNVDFVKYSEEVNLQASFDDVEIVPEVPSLQGSSLTLEQNQYALTVKGANPIISLVSRIFKGKLGKITGKCLLAAAKECISHWSKPNTLIECGKNFVAKNKGLCVFD